MKFIKIKEYVTFNWKKLSRICITLIMILFVLQLIIPEFYTSNVGIETSGSSIKIVTYNIHDASFDDLKEILIAIKPDIVGLQEIDESSHDNLTSALHSLAESLGLYVLPFDPEIYNNYGLAILSRYNASSIDWKDISIIDLTHPRVVLQAIIDTPFGQVQVLNTHLNTPNFYTTRARQLNVILNTWQIDKTSILLGDFNTPSYFLDYTYDKISLIMEDSWVVAGNFHGSGKTYPSDFPVIRIDYIFVSNDIDVVSNSAELFGTSEISDHRGLSVSVCLDYEV